MSRTTKSDLHLEKNRTYLSMFQFGAWDIFLFAWKMKAIEQNLFDKFIIRNMFNKDAINE